MLESIASITALTLLARLSVDAYHYVFEDKEAAEAIDSFYTKYHKFIEVKEIRQGRRLCVLSLSGNKALTIVFVHGSCTRMGHFAEQIAHCHALGYSILSFDLFGCGRSDKPNIPAMYGTEELLEDIKCVLRTCPGEKLLVGHSFGASAVLALEEFDSSVRGVMAIGPVSPHKELSSLAFFRLPRLCLWFLRPLMSRISQKVMFATCPPRICAQERIANARNPVYMFKAYYTRMNRIPLLEPLARDRKYPVLLIAGSEDVVTPYKGVNEVHGCIHTTGTNKIVEVLHAGHNVMLEKPEEINALLEKFLEECM